MTETSSRSRSTPEGWHTVTPRTVAHRAEQLVEFLRQVFGATGDYHRDRPAEIRIGDSIVMISDAEARDPMPAFLYVYVEDAHRAMPRLCAAAAARAKAARPSGQRCARTSRRAAANAVHATPPPRPRGSPSTCHSPAPRVTVLVRPRRLTWIATDPRGACSTPAPGARRAARLPPADLPAFLYVYVEDADDTYRRALQAGATALEEPSDMPYGDRRGMVKDEWGNTWQIATRVPRP